MAKPDPGFWEEIVSRKSPTRSKSVYLAGGKLVVHYLRDAQSMIQVFEADGTEAMTLPMPEARNDRRFSRAMGGRNCAYFTFESYPDAANDLRTGP
jgi:hypothetical protein